MDEKRQRSQPVGADAAQLVSPHLTLAPAWKDPETQALYVHRDLVKVQEPWAEEQHVGPMEGHKSFGDIQSWTSFVLRYGGTPTLCTWNSAGLVAILDYAESASAAGRGTWVASCPFAPSIQRKRWSALANGQPLAQKFAVESLEDLLADIVEPEPGELVNLLRNLRTSVNAQAVAELRPDGTTSVSFSKQTQVMAGMLGTVELPPWFIIAIPVLKGHVDGAGRPVLYRLPIRRRVSVDDSAHLVFRLTIPDLDRVLEDVYAERVREASALLGDQFALLRAAD